MGSVFDFASSLSPATKLCGDHNCIQHPVPLRAGLLSMLLENGSLRYIETGKTEIIRMIYPAVRDCEWLTVEPEITYTRQDIYSDSFLIEFVALYRSERVSYKAAYSYEGKSDSSLILRMEGEALDSFERNRIGFCILHPAASYAGIKCELTHSSGKIEECSFPELISPTQVFSDILGMDWEINGNDVSLTLYGDLFETEDQRNWSDSTFKTYSTPLELPYPVKLAAGEKTAQIIELKTSPAGKSTNLSDETIILAINGSGQVAMPAIGLSLSSGNETLTPEEAGLLSNLNISHLRVELMLFDDTWKDKALRGTTEAKLIGCPVEYVLFVDDDAVTQLMNFINFSEDEHPETALITVFYRNEHSTPDWLADALIPILKSGFPEIRIAVGTNANFAQLNRSIPGTVHAGLLTWSVHPQEHASDILTLTENLQPQTAQIESARGFAGDKGIWISPVTIQRRFNANTSSFEIPLTGKGVPPQVDSRIMSLYGACWTAGSMKYILESGPDGVTYFETTGERGIMQGDSGPRWPSTFTSYRNMIFPLFHVFKFVLNYRNYRIAKSKSSSPLESEILTLVSGNDLKIIVINFTVHEKKVLISGCKNITIRRVLNEQEYAAAVSDPDWLASGEDTVLPDCKLTLSPYSVVFASAESV